MAKPEEPAAQTPVVQLGPSEFRTATHRLPILSHDEE
jgi:hypothetical protein